jgi:hypothetical protein
MKLRVYTNPDVHTVEDATWDHPALTAWQHAVVVWDRDYGHLEPNSIHVWNGDRRPNLWIGTHMVEVLYGRTSGVVRWCGRHARWELVHSHRDCHIDSFTRARQLSIGNDEYSRRKAPAWRALGIPGY